MSNIITFTSPPVITNFSSVVGKKEGEGPLKNKFDIVSEDDTFGQANWEKAESQMMKTAVIKLLEKSSKSTRDIDLLVSGDLLNQCVGSVYGIRDFGIKYMGLYGACSTMAEGLMMASVYASTYYNTCVAAASSHFCSAEKQFRFPLEYGGQRPPTSQWTVTGAAGLTVEKQGTGVKIKRALPGKIIDLSITDTNNMGAAMAPAACDTLSLFLKESGESPDNYDLIATGDLGFEGEKLVRQLIQYEGYDFKENYTDCGLLIYDRQGQDVHAGGSGCGCSAVVLSSYILPKLLSGELKRVLFVGTGALMSQSTSLEGETIPGIAHLVELEA